MADEIGSNLNGAATVAMFAGDQTSPVALSAIRTAGANETITLVKYRIATVGSCTTASVGLYAVNGSNQPTGAPIYTRQAIATGGTNGLKTAAVSWALTNGTRYVLALSQVDSILSLVATAQANGTSYDDNTPGQATFTHRGYYANIADIAGDVTVGGGSSTTINPTTGSVTVNGRAASMNPFTNVRIREVLINEAGSPVGNRTGMSLLIWYGGSPVGTPDLSYSALTTDAAGTTSWSIATGSLVYNQAIFYVATDGGTSLSVYTCARMIPTYS